MKRTNDRTCSNPSGLCMCGCGLHTPIAWRKERGRDKGCASRYLRGHNRRLRTTEYIIAESGCWEWQRGKTTDGYGQTTVDGKVRPAHRVIYERFKGSIPAGLFLDHLCRNPSCVNPDHLEPVTNAENIRRGSKTKLTPEQVAEIRSLEGQVSKAEIAKRFGLCYDTVFKIHHHQLWRD